MSVRVFIVSIVLVLPLLASAATITVRKDGTGDYSVLQQALNAAAAGDTVRIGPGTFSDRTTIPLGGGSYDIESCGVVKASNLTIIGSGVDFTTIGLVEYDGYGPLDTPQGITCDITNGIFRISDLTIADCDLGIRVRCTLSMDNCRLVGNGIAASWIATGSGGHIADTRIEGRGSVNALELIIGSGVPAGDFVLDRCYVSGVVMARSIQGMAIRDCDLGAATFMMGTRSTMVRCTTMGSSLGITQYSGGGLCEIDDCVIRGGISALNVNSSAPGGRFVVANSRLEGGSQAILLAGAGSGACVIHGSDLVKGSGAVVVCGASTAVVTHDLTGNWWGTSSAADIEGWITDHTDNPSIGATVLYSPFAGQSVPAETTTWGDLKALFR